MLDIARNEHKNGLLFDHIWVDSGTGMTAATLIAMNALLKRKSQIHVVLTAGDEAYFSKIYLRVAAWLSDILQRQIPSLQHVSFHFPVTARSFGHANQTILKAVRDFAREDGLLTDPVYTAKLFLTAKTLIAGGDIGGSQLIIHSGGGTGLMGFAERMQQIM